MEFTDYFKNRRTIRKYSAQEVPDSMISEMLEAAMQAPTTGNMQLYSVVVTRSEDGKRALAPAHFNQPSVTSSSAVLTFCADFNRFVKWCRESGADPGYDNFQSFVSAMLDTAIVAQQFCTIAEMRGLGTCYLGTTTWNAPQIASALELPSMVVPVITVTVGYPAEDVAASDRLPIEAVVHNERYRDYTPEEIHRYYDPKEALPENRGFVAENGKQSLAQVFTDVRYPRQANEHFSAIFYGFLNSAGFRWPAD
ncbi:MAG: nitroreductase family protein [Muribaculaceae bacterium]|nr:nitroreductase family protein [Muribaculaceae bacterium]